MASLRDVAELAGVSVATASRVATGAAAVRPATRERVERAMRDLLYVPPGRVETDDAVGLFVPEFGNPVFAALAAAMETEASRAGLATILCNTHGSAQRELEYMRMLLERRVEGMVFISAEITDVRGEHSHYAQLVERGARLVFVNGGSEELDVTSVGVDERAAGRMATEHLIRLGHTRIGFVAGNEFALPTRDKSRGRLDALAAAGLDGAELVAHAGFTVEGGRAALRKLMDRDEGERPTGVICSNDLMAIGAVQEAIALGLDVPAELSVVGFDGIAARWSQPPLTTVEQPIDELARTAIDALRAQIERPDQTQPSYVFRPRLRTGRTTAPAPSPV
jgi:LacI family repressor for deo operon, udp, cdd, tsx, nupC, and nupG